MVALEEKLGRSYRPIPIHLDADFGERAAARSRNMAKAVLRIEDSAVRGADEHFAGRIVVDRDALVCAGSLAGYEVPIRQVDEQARGSVRRIREAKRVVFRQGCRADHRTGVWRGRWPGRRCRFWFASGGRGRWTRRMLLRFWGCRRG